MQHMRSDVHRIHSCREMRHDLKSAGSGWNIDVISSKLTITTS